MQIDWPEIIRTLNTLETLAAIAEQCDADLDEIIWVMEGDEPGFSLGVNILDVYLELILD